MKVCPHYQMHGKTFKADAYANYAEMRRSAPVYRGTDVDGSLTWFVTRHADVKAVLQDHQRFVKNGRSVMTAEQLGQPGLPPPDEDDFIRNHMLNKDGPDHSRLRGLVNKAFTPRVIEPLRGRVHAIAHQLLDRVEERGQMDLIGEYAYPLPLTVIGELLGIPATDHERFRQWANAMVKIPADREEAQAFAALKESFLVYLHEVFTRRRRQPDEGFISMLIQARDGQDRLNDQELSSMASLLIVAGHETTVNLIGNGMLALLRHPRQLQRLKNDASLMPAAVEEILRYDGPAERAMPRWAAQEVQIGGQTIGKGEKVVAVLGSADRDSEHFEDADVFDIGRREKGHLALGFGVHFCLGASLARMEGEIALGALLERLPDIRLQASADELEWRPINFLRGLEIMPVVWD
jgi:cytochrome P450